MRLPGPPLSTYLVAHVPGWTAVCVLAWAAVTWFGVPRSTGILVVVVVLLKDALTYRTMRRYYTPEPSERRLVDHRGVAVTPLAPGGWVRVRGELWRAHVASGPPVAPGSAVRVCHVEGLVLIVEQPSRAA
jgi:membrane protein implicated in regulation of membrane protease activity